MGEDVTVDSDAENLDRTGVAPLTGGAGRVVTDRAEVVAEDGTVVAGTRTAQGNLGGNDNGGRIVLASEGVSDGEGKTKLADPADYARVPLSQLLAGTAGTAAYDWLTVDTERVLVDSWTDEGGLEHEVWDRYSIPLAGGYVGATHPTRQSIRGILWNDANNNGI